MGATKTSAGSIALMLLAASAAVGAVYLVAKDLKSAQDDPPPPKPKSYYRNPVNAAVMTMLASEVQPGMRLAFHRWMASTKLELCPERWRDMVVDAVDIRGKSVRLHWSGTFLRRDGTEVSGSGRPPALRLDAKILVLTESGRAG